MLKKSLSGRRGLTSTTTPVTTKAAIRHADVLISYATAKRYDSSRPGVQETPTELSTVSVVRPPASPPPPPPPPPPLHLVLSKRKVVTTAFTACTVLPSLVVPGLNATKIADKSTAGIPTIHSYQRVDKPSRWNIPKDSSYWYR
ncbi:hypothetical protein RvY_03099 [Ramazzottius varieornatus]|uniref:Uncharacterized protein n=1 Tax=Ramazzottius varieornatus TaxID=947166 RepID=A0A1D1UMR1_RAMVA|nr:hypothetical protein RvY_03099 [Ramazzottius varieornatus]